MSQSISLDTIIKADGVVSHSDQHGNYKALEEGLKYAQKTSSVYLTAGDITNDYRFPELMDEFDIKTPQELFFEHAYEKVYDDNSEFNEQDFNTIMIQNHYQHARGNLESLIKQIPEEDKEKAKETISQHLEYGTTNEFGEKINQLNKDFLENKRDEILHSSIQSHALYFSVMDLEAQKFAESLNKYSEVPVLMTLGNHENAYFTELTRQYLTNKEQLVSLNEQNVGIQTQNNEIISIAGMTNSTQLMPYISQIFSQEDQDALYSHMALDEFQEKSFVKGEIPIENIEELRPIFENDREYKRITEKNPSKLEKELDVFVSHGQIGKPQSKKSLLYETPYLASAAALSLEAQLSIEGHIHSSYEGENSFGKPMIRPTDNEAIHFTKENGEITIKNKVEVDPFFSGNLNNHPGYSKSDIEKLYKTYMFQMSNQVEIENIETQ